jgi:hypothetical protein
LKKKRLALLGNTKDDPTHPVYFDLGQITSHTLLAGSSVDELHSTSIGLLYQLWRNNNLPFLILDISENSEYYQKLQNYFGEDLRVYHIGSKTGEPLLLDLLSHSAESEQTFEKHIDTIFHIFTTAFPETASSSLAIPLKTALSKWLHPQRSDTAGFLNFTSLIDTVRMLTEEDCGCYDEVTKECLESMLLGNVRNLCQSRLEPFICTEYEAPDIWEKLFVRPVLLRLHDIRNLYEKRLAILLFLNKLRNQAKKINRHNSLRLHLTIINELHSIICADHNAAEHNQSLGKGRNISQFLNDLLSIGYAGEAFAFIDTAPAFLPAETLANMKKKILHRIQEPTEMHDFAKAAGLNKEERGFLANLKQNHALWLPGHEEARHVLMLEIE